jgi:hypothetical protein
MIKFYYFSIINILLLIILNVYSIDWGQLFIGPTTSNVIMDCDWNGHPICCAAVQSKDGKENCKGYLTPQERDVEGRGVGYGLTHFDHHNRSNSDLSKTTYNIQHPKHLFNCTKIKKYIPSPYELRHLAKAKEIQLEPDLWKRKVLIATFMSSVEEVNASVIWLKRVNIHGQNDLIPIITDDDYEYLSRFEITLQCHQPHSQHRQHHNTVSNKIENETWLEWIEPLSVHGRHPFSITKNCNMDEYYKDLPSNITREAVQNSDYVLVQSPLSQYNNSLLNHGYRTGKKTNHYLFDAGSSFFSSSLYWFTCAYSQRFMSFDQIFGWEVTLLEPNQFWKEMPEKWTPYYHFFNVPISSDIAEASSVLRIIENIADEEDFVSFKLDIDTPEVEIPIVLDIAQNPKIAGLIDEFFFELHFRCEFMM